MRVSNSDDVVAFLERKVFFLHPSVLIQNQIIEELAQEEFEVYAIKDESRLRHLLKKYPRSIVFANISDGMRESAWEEWIRSVMTNSEITGVDIGIIASTEDSNLRHKYTERFKVRCGYTVIRSDLPGAIKQLENILRNAQAKGRRKYIRAMTADEPNITVNIPINGTFIKGAIRDISAVGFSCYFESDPRLIKNSHFTDIQIRLKMQLLKVQGVIFGSRIHDSKKIYVILFSQRTSPDVIAKIRKFIRFYLQSKIDADLKGSV